MLKMIAYISVPFLLDNQETKNKALKQLNGFLGKFYRDNPDKAAVNCLYSVYDNPLLQDKATYRDVYSASELLIRSAEIHITLNVPGWEYSELVLNERHLARNLNKVMLIADYEPPNTDYAGCPA
jgi:hypothetical protein